MPPLQHKVALITGASSGIGRAIARRLAREGCNVMLNARSADKLEALRQEIEAEDKVEAAAYAGSMADASVVEGLVEATMARFGRLDILVNNAAISSAFELLQEVSVETIDEVIDINLKGPMYAMKFTIPHMVRQGGGTIVNMNSIAGKTAYAYSSPYCASKFGLAAVTECVSEEQRQNNIRILGIYPGAVLTPMWQVIEPNTQHDPKHMLNVEDIANAVFYAVSQPENCLVKDITIVPLIPHPH